MVANNAPMNDDDQRGGERLAGAALLGQRMAVEGRRHRPWFAGDVEQNGADAAAEQRAPIDRRQHDDGGGVGHREGQRQQNGDAVGAADAGQEAEQHAEQNADHHVADVHRRQQHVEAVHQRKERVQLKVSRHPGCRARYFCFLIFI